MNDNEILDDFTYEENEFLSEELINTVIACAKYAKYFVLVAILYDVLKFFQQMYMVSQLSSLNYYTYQSLFTTLISFISMYFLWQFAKTAALLDYMGEREFVKALQSLKLYFIAHLAIMIFWKIGQYLGPMIGQFLLF